MSSPCASLGDLVLEKPKENWSAAHQPGLKADDGPSGTHAKAEQERPDETDVLKEEKNKHHADIERKRRDNTGVEVNKIGKSLPPLLGRPLKQSDCKKALVPRLTILEECSDFLEECIRCFKALGGKGQSFVSLIQTLIAEVQSLRSENLNLKQEISRLRSGEPTPPSSNHPSPIRGSRSQPGFAIMGHHRKESYG